MALDLEEQEQIEELKAWWKTHGRFVIVGITLFVASVVGWRVWESWMTRQATEASSQFEAAMQASGMNEAKPLKDSTSQIMDKHGRTGYATPAAWLVGKHNLDANEAQSAIAQYRYALEHARDPGVEQLARLRLAAVLFDQQQLDEALKLCDVPHDASFAALFANLKGDILVAQKQIDAARGAYKLALEKLDEKSAMKGLIEMKLDGLGS